ncbi:aminopeptidase P family protein [Lysobacter sp. SG-8]|uniref:Aminopeptidase P family protein n=1 Tax=Marilutibacter penaei TaxID=2759900 RepID=A0A7W3YET2_9GAMM|nr:Xaa-Pro peptidase family protein [Lysobacter penaei]MBB1088575.1 aminopeptidase P family protein [Lysobacter penaei]
MPDLPPAPLHARPHRGPDAVPRSGILGPAPIARPEYLQRIAHARMLMQQNGMDACVIHAGANLRYFSGVSWGGTERMVALLLFPRGEPVLVCPEFEVGSLQGVLQIETALCTWQEHEPPAQAVATLLRDNGCRLVAVDPLAPWFMVEALQRAMGAVPLCSAAPVTDICRMQKSPAELALIQQAMSITIEVQQQAFESLRPGMTTRQVRAFIDETHRALGADGGSTFCAVQFGEATAYPHGIAGDQQLQRNDLVLVDTGCQVEGYHSDITRTYAFGTPSDEHRRLWDLERDAQQAAFDAVRVGVTCESIDNAARSLLTRAGLGPDYRLPGLPHRTGHGIGLAIHEPPYLVRGDRTPLQAGMCFSNEPMIVVPRRFGIRLEDHFHVTDTGARWFTPPAESIARPFG